ncbi:MAG: hypothetical protein AB7G11_16935 [Phycisphaerales bacterium]
MSTVDHPSTSCAKCGYELAGLPSVICPECGCDTVKEALARSRRRRVSRHWLILPAAFTLAYAFFLISRPFPYLDAPAAGVIFLLAFAGIMLRWLRLAEGSGRADSVFVMVIVPLIASRAIWMNRARFGGIDCRDFLALHVWALLVLLVAWAAMPSRRFWKLGCAVGTLVLAGAGSVLTHALHGLWIGHSWSAFDTPWISRINPAYPLRYDELLPMTIPYFLMGVAIIVLSLTLRRSPRG